MNEMDFIELATIIGPHGATMIILLGMWMRFAKNGHHEAPCPDLKVVESKVDNLAENNGEQWAEIRNTITDVAGMKSDIRHIKEGQDRIEGKLDSLRP